MSECVDLKFRGTSRVIASAVLRGRDGLTVIDPGPTSCLPVLEAHLHDHGDTLRDVRRILLTHIHLDHAGATGTIVERVPSAEVYVHEVGAPHMVDPARLMASATRLYGDQMDVLWGPFQPVPQASIHVLTGGERLDVGGAPMRVAYTPGHAKHHVSFLDDRTGVAYVGDTAGVRVSGDYLLAPTPPPDIDMDAWRASLDVIEAWQPVSLFLTHFGSASPARAHIDRFRSALAASAETVKALLDELGTDDERLARFLAHLRADIRRTMSENEARATELAAPFEQLWQGLARYWRKRS